MRVEMARCGQFVVGAIVVAMMSAAAPAVAAGQNTNYDELYAHYLATARGAKESDRLWMADLTSDLSARRANDLITIRVVEALSATGSANSNIGKSTSAAGAMPGGKLLSTYVPASTDAKFKGNGGTTRSTDLSATVTARVVEVLPSGDLVVEGVHEIDINGDRSLVVLSGVVRPTDIQPGNVVPSTMVGQLRIRSLSQGLMHDSLAPGWLIRALNKVF